MIVHPLLYYVCRPSHKVHNHALSVFLRIGVQTYASVVYDHYLDGRTPSADAENNLVLRNEGIIFREESNHLLDHLGTGIIEYSEKGGGLLVRLQLMCLILFILPHLVDAETIRVPSDQPTIQVGLDVPAGNRMVHWHGAEESGIKVASGVYLYCLTVGEFVQSRKLLLLK